MANSEDLILWLSANLDHLNFVSTKLKWIDDFKILQTDISSEFIFDNQLYIGRGTDLKSDTAILKSFSECIERFGVCYFNLQTTNGVACHPDLNIATQNAYEELIERHLFLNHFHSGIPFYKTKPTLILLKQFAKSFEILIKENIELNFFLLLESSELYSVMVVASGFERTYLPWGYTFGMGTSKEVNIAFEKALIENLRKLSFYIKLKSPIETLSLEKFKSIPNPNFDSHGKLALDLDYAESIKFLFSETGFKSTSLNLGGVENAEYNLQQIELFKDLPLALAKTTSVEAQSLYVGDPVCQINLRLLEEFSIRAGVRFKPHLMPHPLD
jgi:hypothetical protein